MARLTTGEVVGGTPFKPRVRLIGEFGADSARERAARRLEAFVASEATRRLAPLKGLMDAIADGRLKGLARGVAYQLVEQFGVLDRRRAHEHVSALSRGERRMLKSLSIRFGAFSLYLPGLLAPEARAIGAVFAALAAPRWRPQPDALAVLPHPLPPPEALGLRGLSAVGGLAVPALALERLDALSRANPAAAGLVELTPELTTALGWTRGQTEEILRSLGFVRTRKADDTRPSQWRRRLIAPRPLGQGPAGDLGRAAKAAIPAPRPAAPVRDARAEPASGRPPAQFTRRKRRKRAKSASPSPNGATH